METNFPQHAAIIKVSSVHPLRVLVRQLHTAALLAGAGPQVGRLWQKAPRGPGGGEAGSALSLMLWTKNMLSFVSFSRKHFSG